MDDEEKAALRSLEPAALKAAITHQLSRVHRAVHDGSLDKTTVADALMRLTVLTKVDQDEPAAAPAEAPQEAEQPA